MAKKDGKNNEELFKNIIEYINTIEDKPLELYTEQIQNALESMTKDIGLSNTYGENQIKTAIKDFDLKTIEKSVSKLVTPYLQKRKESILKEVQEQLISQSKNNGISLSKTITQMTQNETQKMFSKAKFSVDKKMIEDLNLADPNLVAYHYTSNRLKQKYPENNYFEDFDNAIIKLSQSFSKKTINNIDDLLKQTGISSRQWSNIQARVRKLQSEYSKKISQTDIERIIRGQIEKFHVNSRNAMYIKKYTDEGKTSYLKRNGYDSFVKDDKLIPAGTSVGIVSDALEKYMKSKGSNLSYNNLNEQYEGIIKKIETFSKKKSSSQKKEYDNLLKEKTFIEQEFEKAVRNTEDKSFLDDIFSNKISGSYGGLLGEMISKKYAKDSWYDEWLNETKSAPKQERAEGTSKILSDLKEIEVNNVESAREDYANKMKTLGDLIKGQGKTYGLNYEESFLSLKELTDNIISGKISFKDGKDILKLLDGSFRQSLNLDESGIKTVSIGSMGGNDIGYSNGKWVSTGFNDNDIFDTEDYEAQQQIAETAGDFTDNVVTEAAQSTEEMIYSSFRSAVLSTIELRRKELKEKAKQDAENFYGRKPTEKELEKDYEEIDRKTNQVANMANETLSVSGRKEKSFEEQVIDDANALSNILEYANAYKFQQTEQAKAQAKLDKKEFNEKYLSSYISSHMPDEEIISQIEESAKARKVYDSVISSGGSYEEAIESAIKTIIGKTGNRIDRTWQEASNEGSVLKTIDKDGNELYMNLPSQKKMFTDLVVNQLSRGATSDNPAHHRGRLNKSISGEEWKALSPAGRRLVDKMRGFDDEPTVSPENYDSETIPINIDKMREEYEQRETEKRIQNYQTRVQALNKKETQKENQDESKNISDSKTNTTKKKTTKKKLSSKKKATSKKKEISNVIEDENKEFSNGLQPIQEHTEAIQNEMIAEKNKVDISEILSKVLQEERKAFDNTSSVEKSTNAIEENTNAIKENSEAKKENADNNFERPISPSRLIQGVFGDDFSPNDVDFEKALNEYSLKNNGVANAEKLGITDGEGMFKRLSGNYYSRVFGSIEHLQSQISDEVFNETGKSLNINDIIKNSSQYSSKIQELIKEYNDNKEMFYSNLEKLGFTKEDLAAVEKRLEYAVKAQQEIAKKISPSGHADMNEVPLMGEVNGQGIHGITDKLYLDGDTLNISDLKNKFKIKGDRESIQLGMYQTMLTQMKQRVTDWDEGRTEKPQFEDIEGNLLDEETNDKLIGILRQAKFFKTYIQNVNGQLEAQLIPITSATTEEIGQTIEMLKDGKVLTDEEKEKMATKSKSVVAGQGGYIPSPDDKDYNVSWFDNNRASEAEQNSLITQAINSQKAKDKVIEQIDLLARKAEDPSRLKSETQSYLEQIKLLQQKLAILNQTEFILNKEGNLVKLVNNEEAKNIPLQEQQLAKYKEQMLLLENQHKTAMAKNEGYINKDKQGFFGAVFGQIQQTFEYLTRTSIVYGVIGKIQSTFTTLIQTVQSLDSSMVDLQIATNTTRSELQESTKDYNSMATEMGRTTQEVMSAANDWLRAGYQTEQANSLIQNSMKLSTLGMIDSAKATEYLISTMKGWKLSVEDVNQVVDEMTALDAAAALTAGDLANAMAKANVSASLAGIDRQSYEAMLTTVIDTSQQGAESVGTAFKTLFARYGNVKSGKYANKYDSTDTSGEFESLNDIETVLNKAEIKMRNTVGQFREMQDVLDEIASKWSSMDQITQNAITTAMAGTRQRETFNVLMENYDQVNKFRNVAKNSTGSADEKMEYYKDSVEASRNRLTAALEKLVSGKGLENILIMVNNTLTEGIKNIKTLAFIVTGLIAIYKGKALANSILKGGTNLISGYMGLTSRFSNANLLGVSDWFTTAKKNVTGAFETAQMNQFDISLQNITKTLQVTDVNIAKLGKDALTSGQLIIQGLGKDKNIEFASKSVESRINAVDLATNYSPETINTYLRYSPLYNKEKMYNNMGINFNEDGTIIGGRKNAAKILAKENNISTKEAEVELKAFAESLKQANLEIQKNTNANERSTISELKEADANDISAATKLQEANGGMQLTREQGTVVKGIFGDKNYEKNAKGLKGGFKEAGLSTVGMVGSMVGTGMVMSETDKLGTGGTMAMSGLTSLMPMLGSMIGNAILPGIGGAIGTAVGGGVSTLTGLLVKQWAKSNKTTEEILKETQKATEEISGLKENLSKNQETLTNLKDSEVRFAELVKGVNSTTGENVSLSDTEWSEYQDILSSIIDSRSDLYASYDEEGNIVAKNAGKIADLNKVMSESISQTEEQIRLKNWEIANNKDKKGNYNIASYVNQDAVSAYSEIEKSVGNLSDNFDVYGRTDKGFKDKDFEKIWDKYNVDTLHIDYLKVDEAFEKLLKAGATVEDLYTVFKDNFSSGESYDEFNPVSFEDFSKVYSPIISNYNKAVNNVQQEYTNGLRNALKINFEGTEEYSSLSNEEQNYLSQTVFGNIQANPYKKNDQSEGIKDIEDASKAYERYKTVSENAMKWAMLNPDKMEFLSGYDESTMTIANDKTRTQYLLEMLKGQDAGSVRSILKGMGYNDDSLSKYFHQNKKGDWIWDGNFDDIVENIKSSVDKNLQELTNKDFGFSKDKLETLTGAEFNALYTNRNALRSYAGSSAEELQRKLKEFTLGNNGTLSEYLSDFSNEMDIAISNTEEFAKALDTAKGKGTFAFEKLQKLANNLGIDIHELADHASTLGSIDANGYNSKSLSEIETQFEDIENIVNDLTDNSTISAENVEKIIEDFPELVKYLDDSDKLLEKFQSLQGDKSKLQVASLKRSFAESDEVYKSLLNDTKFSDNEDFDKITEQRLGMFKNGRKLTEFMNTIYNKDINDNYTEIKSEYEKMSLTDNSSYSQNSWEKLIGENIFGVDTSTGTKEEIQKKIYNAMKAQAEKMGVKNIDSIENGGMNQLTKMFTNIIGQTDLMAAFQQVSDLQNQLSALKTAKAIEDSKWGQRVSDAISKLKQDFEEGRTSIDDYIKGLQQIKTWTGLTAEQQNELNEAIEEARFDKISDQYEKGVISVKAYRDELSALMKLNASGSSQYKQYADAYISSYDTEFNKLEAQMSLVAEKDFAQQENILAKERLVIQEQLMALVAAGMQDSEEYLEKQKELKSIDEKRLEIEKKRVELHKEDLETTMSAYTTLLDYGISQLEKEKSLLEERYDEEIDKLKEVNDQKQRSIDLEKYQQQLENAKKEKSRVYIAGMGWTYRANQAKVDEAQRNLDNYLDDRKISDLEGSKNRESKYYQDQIDFYNEMKEKVEDVPKLANTEDAVRQLIKDGILPEGSTIPDSLNILRQNTKLDNEGHVISLGGKFESIKNDYLTTTEKLWHINSNWDQNLLDIANKIRASEPVTTEMLKRAFKDGVSQVDIKIPIGKDYSEQIKEIQRKLATAQSTLSNIAMSAAAISYKDTTSSSGVWSKGMNKVDMSKTYKGLDSQKYWKMTNTETGDEWYIRANTSNVRDIWNKRENRYTTVANKGTDYYRSSILGFSSGIEAGMVTRTGMYKLHGSPSNPEFVLNSKQAYQLLKNISTLSIPAFESNNGKSQTIKYQFYGDLNLPNVQDPSTFFDELLRETNSKFNVSKPEYS